MNLTLDSAFAGLIFAAVAHLNRDEPSDRLTSSSEDG